MESEDRIYLEALKNEDFSAFETLFRKYAERLYAFVLSITKEPYIAEEVTQLVFIKIWEQRERISEHLSFKSFLFSIAYNETISWLRKENAEKRRIQIVGQVSSFVSNETNFTIEFNSIHSLANELISNLPEKRREIFKLSREQGYSNKEIAEILGISVKTVENQITAALKTLREKLGDKEMLGILFYFLMLY